jgi:hypothetical protein
MHGVAYEEMLTPMTEVRPASYGYMHAISSTRPRMVIGQDAI